MLAYRCYYDGTIYYNLTICTKKSLMTDLGLLPRKAYKVGVNFNREKRCIDEWKVISLLS